MGKNWGMQPKHVKWLNESIVRLMLAHGAIVWAFRVQSSHGHLARIQRLALQLMGSFKCSTPLAGLEAMFGVAPIDLALKGEAMAAARRIDALLQPVWDGIGEGKKRGHRWLATGGEACKTDRIPLELDWD